MPHSVEEDFQSPENGFDEDMEEMQNYQPLQGDDDDSEADQDENAYYHQIPSDDEEQTEIKIVETKFEQITVSTTVITPPKQELSPESQRKKEQSMKEFDERYRKEVDEIQPETTSEMKVENVDIIKNIMKTIHLPNAPRWAQPPPN
eukprot:TRINITY_DN4124_c0_g1_i1.p1 TRINITY_DN4124_c0_g1~~TRINITY_DN4124_c0_g1_i1.p1  ORF type:complete len:147 (+),score=39.62 TRINITY_DN4124_c0_g1_i1:16-456(+)